MKSVVLCERTLVRESENFSILKEGRMDEESNEKEEEKKVINRLPDVRMSASDVSIVKNGGVSFQNGDRSSDVSLKADVAEVDIQEREPSLEADNPLDESILRNETNSVAVVERSSSCSDRDETDCSSSEKLVSENEILENFENEEEGLLMVINDETKSGNLARGTNHGVAVEKKELKIDEKSVQPMEGILLDKDENKENEKDEKTDGADVYSGNDLNKLSGGCEIQVGEVQTISGAEKDSMWAENDLKKYEQDSKEKSEEKVTYECPDIRMTNEESVDTVGDEKQDESQELESDENVISEIEENLDEGMHIEVEESDQTEEVKVEEKENELTDLGKSVTGSNSDSFAKRTSAICRKRQIPQESIKEDSSVKKKRLTEAREEAVVHSAEENSEDSCRCESVASLDSTGVSSKDPTLTEENTTKRTSTDERSAKKFNLSVEDEESGCKKNQAMERVFPVLEKFRGTLRTLTRSDLEELIVQKLCEVITERSNVGELRRKAQALEQDQERWKAKAQSLAKQMREMEMVMKKYMTEVQKQVKEGDTHVVTPLKVTRSVGLQVSFYSSSNKGPKGNIAQSSPSNLPQNVSARNVKSTPPKIPTQFSPTNLNLRNKPSASFQKGAQCLQKSPVNQQRRRIIPKSDFTPSPTSRPVAQHSPVSNTRLSNQVQTHRTNFKSLVGTSPQQQPQQSQSQQSQSQQHQQQNGSKVIDLTDDDDRQTGNVVVKTSGPIRVVNHLSQSPGAQNNKFAYLLPTTSATTATSAGQNRQVLIAAPTIPQSNRQIMCSMPPLLFKGGNVVQSGAQPQMPNQSNKHPAPLPKRPVNQNTRPSLKLIPPRPALKISKVQTGIVLSWNMALSQEHAPIASYQLYAYQESDSPPATSLWKKVGDVKALPLPMACTLTQFMSGHKYHFAVRAVDLHSRIGPFSFPGTIVLV